MHRCGAASCNMMFVLSFMKICYLFSEFIEGEVVPVCGDSTTVLVIKMSLFARMVLSGITFVCGHNKGKIRNVVDMRNQARKEWNL